MSNKYGRVVKGIRLHIEDDVFVILYDSKKHSYDSIMSNLDKIEELTKDDSIAVIPEEVFNSMVSNQNADVVILK